MAKTNTKIKIKVPNLEQCLDIIAGGKHPYYHPCSCCEKACSTPTKQFWQKRVKEYGSVQEVYKNYRCRDCKKVVKTEKKAEYQIQSTERKMRKPGDYVKLPEGSMGVSVFEEGKLIGTTFYPVFPIV
jgi:hypothetical protein